MADIIDLSLIADSRRYFHKLLDKRGIAYFLRKDGHRLFQIEQAKVEMVVRTAARARKDFKESDRIRDELAAMGVVIKDSKEGTTWEIAR